MDRNTYSLEKHLIPPQPAEHGEYLGCALRTVLPNAKANPLSHETQCDNSEFSAEGTWDPSLLSGF